MEDADLELDDSCVEVDHLISSLLENQIPEGYEAGEDGCFEVKTEAENLDDGVGIMMDVESKSGDNNFGRGKRLKQNNRMYKDFWRH